MLAIAEDRHLAARQDVERIRGFALPGRDVARCERCRRQLGRKRECFVLGERGEQFQRSQQRNARSLLVHSHGRGHRARRMQVEVRARDRNLHARPPQRGVHVHSHPRIGLQVSLEVGQPVVDDVLDRARVEFGADAVRHRPWRHERYLEALERRAHHRQHLSASPFVADAELDRPPPRYTLVAATPEQCDLAFHELRIRDHDRHVGHGRQRGIAPADAHDFTGEPIDLDPVADAVGVVELQRDAAHEVA